ncbi:mechanosensitive ion channel family protein [Luteimonas sp. BDR2-5]|uniref:mechanosensitive ion channel family protein n=1 Tax=Proluteimonas luteida TaxID=2878685 RepID=UPI001E34E8D9|nr:mechanosensitive ion channel domain-containing protein [Luteimonas sp. BDR2-5]MCD9029986.1 mechanosensitive ion channel family protein [Luteimonas sp. BDR2-5]
MRQQLDHLQAVLAPYPWAYTLVVLAGLLLAAWLANWVTKRVLLRGLLRVLRATPLGGRDHNHAVQLRVIPRLANVVPALVISAGIGVVPDLPPEVVTVVRALCQAFVVLTVALSVSRLLDTINHAYERRPDAQNKPIKGYFQVVKIIMFVLVGISIIATLIGAQFLHILTGLGAMTAVLMLIFQDTILSLVASVQISNDGRVRIGDWIEMPSQNADGDVIDIALHTITVRNWDRTVTTVPTKKLVSDAFKNWRPMFEGGGRRIKRALFLDQHSVRFLEPDEVARFRRFVLLDDYLDEKARELEAWNAKLAERGAEPVNARRVTNLGTFRAYVNHYLRNHPGINQDLILLVRQLQPTAQGLPLEIYCFTSDTGWVGHENTQSDIFDHLIALLPEFGLKLFQDNSDAPLEVNLHQADTPADVSPPPATARLPGGDASPAA